jgi:hypothetical protein
MAMAIVPGRFTAHVEEPVVVFLIGMRINRLRAVRKWLPVMREMGPMLKTLYQHPEKGLLHAETFLMWRGIMQVQYWRSFEALERFARSKDEPHAAAWQRFMRNVGGDGTVGIFHETYVIQPGAAETIYGNMPVFGLAAATEHVAATGARATARARLQAGRSEPRGLPERGSSAMAAPAA